MLHHPPAVSRRWASCWKNLLAYLIPCHRVIRETYKAGNCLPMGTIRKTRRCFAWESNEEMKPVNSCAVKFLRNLHLPARLTAEETAKLERNQHDIPVLVSAGFV